MADNEKIFRKKTLERIASPEQLNDYLRVTNPGIWAVLAAVILLLAGLFAWSAIGTLETTVSASAIVENRTASVVANGSDAIEKGMLLRIDAEEYTISSSGKDEYGRNMGVAQVDLPDGSYEGTLVVERIHPIDFLLKSN